MNEPLPDHYDALQLPRDAPSAAIKTAYRKAALKYHPDKNQGNPSVIEQFHRIQTAYDILSDDQKRKEYDADLKLKALRDDIKNRRGNAQRNQTWGGDQPRGSFNPDFHFGSPFYGSMNGGRGPIFEERRPGGSPRSPRADDDREGYFSPRTTTRPAPPPPPPPPHQRDFDPYEEYEIRKPTSSSARRASDKGSIRVPKSPAAKAKAKEHQTSKKTRDKERNADRKAQPRAVPSYVEDASNSSDEDATASPRRSYDRREPVMEERRRRVDLQSDDDFYERSRKLGQQTSDMRDYIKSAGGRVDIPSLNRTVSYQDGRTPVVRRSAKSKSSSDKDKDKDKKDKARDSQSDREKEKAERRGSADRRSAPAAPPPLQTSSSSPGNIRIPRARTFEPDDAARQPAPPPMMRRSETMPIRPKRQDSTPVQPSGLRHTETTSPDKNAGRDSGYNTGSPSDDTSKRYQEFFTREPSRRVARSPSPINRSPYSRSTAVFEDDIVGSSPGRRPSAQRTDSTRSGKDVRIPGLPRTSTMPMPSRDSYDRERDRDPPRDRDRDRDRDSPRYSPVSMNTGRNSYDHRREDSYSRRFVADELRYASYNSSPAGSRRASADAGIAAKASRAQESMDRNRGRGSTPVY